MKARKHRRVLLLAAALCVLALMIGAGWVVSNAGAKPRVLGQADLGDGRILQVEGLTYGTEHSIGNESAILKHVRKWLPNPVIEFLKPPVPRSNISRDEPALVVWVRAISAAGGTNVDCQGVRLDFRSRHGDLYGQETRYWRSFGYYWRVGHLFTAFPRDERIMTLRVTPWRGGKMTELQLPNPAFTEPRNWKGEMPPVARNIGAYKLVLTGLKKVQVEEEYYKTPSAYLEPEIELWRGDRKEQEENWSLDWVAEDPLGNRGQQLGVNQPVLRYLVTLHPSATNLNATLLVTNTPAVTLHSKSNAWWNIESELKSNSVTLLGIFPPGVQVFSGGEYLTNPPMAMAAVQGGAPSGWMETGRQLSPFKHEYFSGHYSDVPTVYLKVRNPEADPRVAIRLRDEHGRAWAPEQEPQGTPGGIVPFPIRVPADVREVSVEVVLLPAIRAEFMVDTGAAAKTVQK